jgi:Rho termination factor, N-terminal domain.
MGDELNQLSLTDLRELAKLKGIKGISKLKKEELIGEINGLKDQENEIRQEETQNKNYKH